MNKTIIFILIGFFIFSTNANADKIYLKSGKILEGKLKKSKNSMLLFDWCTGEDDIELWHNHSGQCLKESNIERIEKEYKSFEGVALLAVDNKWGEEKNGYKLQLISAKEEFEFGNPIIFHLVKKNVSEKLKWYDKQGMGFRNNLVIKNADGETVYYKYGSAQSAGGESPIDKGEIVPLFEQRDLSKQYAFVKPGSYTAQYRGGRYYPSSNIVEFNINQGSPDAYDVLITSLKDILLNKRWSLDADWYNKAPLGRKEVEGKALVYRRHPESGLKADVAYVQVWQTDGKSDVAEPSNKGHVKVSEYLGEDSSGKHYYIYASYRAKKFWPNVKEDIVRVLNLAK